MPDDVLPDPSFWMYEVYIYVGATWTNGQYNGDGEKLGPFRVGPSTINVFIRMVGCYLAHSDKTIRLSMWDENRQEWHDILNRVREPDWDGLFDLRTVVKVGSADL